MTASHPTGTTSTTTKDRTRLRRILVRSTLASAVVAGVVLGGAAIAAWNVTGEGAGSAGAANVVPLDDITLTITGSLYPGVTTDATLAVTNDNPFPVRLIDIEFGDITVTGAQGPGCTAVDSEVSFADILGVTDTTYLIGADDSESFLLVNVVTMGAGANDDCQGATFTVEIELNAESAAP